MLANERSTMNIGPNGSVIFRAALLIKDITPQTTFRIHKIAPLGDEINSIADDIFFTSRIFRDPKKSPQKQGHK